MGAVLVATTLTCVASACSAFSAAEDTSSTPDGVATDGGGENTDGGGPVAPKRIYAVVGERTVLTDAATVVRHTDTVYYATPGASGALPSWTQTRALEPIHGNAVVATGDGLLSLGGEVELSGGASATNATSRATVDASGELDPWTPSTPLVKERYFHASVVVNGHVYVIGGGVIGAATVRTVSTARLVADGSLEWTDTMPLPIPRTRLAAATDGKHIFVVGGVLADNPGCSVDVLVGTPDASGAIPVWKSTGMTFSFKSPAAVVVGKRLYAIGGFDVCDGGGVSSKVVSADIGEDGLLGNFQTPFPLLKPRWALAAVAVGPHIYAVGGDDGSLRVATVFRADLAPDGAFMGDWKVDAELPIGRALFGLAAF